MVSITEVPPEPAAPPTEIYQLRLFWAEEVEQWVGIVHSCLDNKDAQFTGDNLGKLLAEVRRSLIRKDAGLRAEQPEPSPIIGLNGAPVSLD